ncbi:MAG: arylsulfatase, partial [Planctomycetes bacterium]|nr:arylsulfatase [Planctomycetota bacterium]
ECIDWSTGQILGALRKLGLERKTIVVYTSDNGPWLVKGEHGGSALPLRDGKGTTYEGGMREPCVMWGPGRIPAGKTCSEMVLSMDLMPTFAGLAGAAPPADIDGKDVWPLLSGRPGAKTPHQAFYYYSGSNLQAVRSGKWKLVLYAAPQGATAADAPKPRDPELYDLEADISESRNIAAAHPDVVARLHDLAEKGRQYVGGTLGKPTGAPKAKAEKGKAGAKAGAGK